MRKRLLLPAEINALQLGSGVLCVGPHRCKVRIPQRDFVAKVSAFIPRAAPEAKPMASTEYVPHNRYRRIWANIKDRCENKNPKAAGFKNYYSRGITYDKRWEDNYKLFEREIDERFGTREEAARKGGGDVLSYTLDRRDNDQGYFLDNLTGWKDKEWQAQHRRTVKKLQAVEDE